MSNQRKITLRICRRAAYLLSANSAKKSRIEMSDRLTSPRHSHYMAMERQFIARCYRIS